jgi:hypothetical protein
MANEETVFDVTLSDGIGTNPIGLMKEDHLLGWLSSRPLQDLTPEEVLSHLQANTSVTVYFQPPLGQRQRVEIHRETEVTDSWQ